MCKLKI